MSKPDVLVYRVTERYKRPDLVNFIRTSEEMHYPRALWGKGKIVERTSFEELQFNDDYLKDVLSIVSDTIILKDDFERDIIRTFSDSFTFTDDYGRDVTDTKNETITLSDGYTKCPSKYEKDLFFIFDEDERNPNTVLYDLELTENPLDEHDFDNFCEHTTPTNYSTIRPLIAGEYDYRNAIVGVQVRVPVIQGRFGVIGSKVVLDVEDVVQKGRVKVDNTGKMFVKFDKIFYTIPHVIAALVDAETVGAVEVNDISREGFYIGIKDIQGSGAYVEGTVDYLADGY